MSEEQKLLNIFPVEIWIMIFDNITDTTELERLYNAFPFFQQVLFPKRILFGLFPKVWKILNMKFHKQESLPLSRNPGFQDNFQVNGTPYSFCDQCDQFSPTWWRRATFNFRLVCRTWSSSIDKILQVPASYYKASATNPENEAICVEYFNISVVTIRDPGNVNKFVNHFKATHPDHSRRTPFLSRSVAFDFNSRHHNDFVRYEKIPNNIMRLLRKYGHHIWCNEVNFQPNRFGYTEMRQMLKFLPKLKVLRLYYGYGRLQNDYIMSTEEHDQLESEINLRKLPKLKSVQELCVVHLPAVIFNELIRKTNQVEKLEIFGKSAAESDNYNLLQVKLANLVNLSIAFFTEDQFFSLADPKINWPLKTLTLNLSQCGSIDWLHVFILLEEKWAETLTSLELTLPCIKGHDLVDLVKENYLMNLNLPKLVSLKLELPTISTFDFLLPMKQSLEILNISVLYCVAKEEVNVYKKHIESESLVKLLSYSNDLLESNIWTVFPELQALQWKENFPDTDGDYTTEVFQANKREWRRRQKVNNN